MLRKSIDYSKKGIDPLINDNLEIKYTSRNGHL